MSIPGHPLWHVTESRKPQGVTIRIVSENGVEPRLLSANPLTWLRKQFGWIIRPIARDNKVHFLLVAEPSVGDLD